MDGLVQILLLAGFLFAGAALPRVRAVGRRKLGTRGLAPAPAAVDLVIRLILRALLLAMGFRIGNDPNLSSRLAEIGAVAGAAGVLAVLGTLAAIIIAWDLFVPGSRDGRPKPAAAKAPSAGSPASNLRGPALLLGVVVAGFLLGLVLPSLECLDLSALTGWILDALLFFIGMQFSQAGASLKGAFLRKETLILPLATAAGSLGAGLLLVPLFGLAPGKAMVLVGGFGWYSLSGVLISDLGDPVLGSAAFLANMVRESIALLSIPFLARTRIPYLAIGVGGATAMDVTLPLIEQCVGPESVPASFASGALLSLAVPLIVPLLYGIG
jgi:uncharacterized membrane protein YbjE (DUF340 family)